MKGYIIIIHEETMEISAGYQLGGGIEGGRREVPLFQLCYLYRLKTAI